MGESEREKEQIRRARIRLSRIQHYQQVTRNVSQTCRSFGIPGQFYFWLRRYRQSGVSWPPDKDDWTQRETVLRQGETECFRLTIDANGKTEILRSD
jgi:transposase-like protein